MNARIIATIDRNSKSAESEDDESSDNRHNDGPQAKQDQNTPAAVNRALLDAISTMTIQIPPLVDRLEDLPILAQYFLEACNRASSKQVGSLRSDALESLALYSWPGELDQLRETIEAAHAASTSHEITAADLPPIFYQAFRAATHRRREPERIVLDELLAAIEKEAIVRALAQAGGNKSVAATLLGMTRPRLYRRLVQLGLAREEADGQAEAEAPEFIESDSGEE
jgi:DNA-binding NtrC family response regulator